MSALDDAAADDPSEGCEELPDPGLAGRQPGRPADHRPGRGDQFEDSVDVLGADQLEKAPRQGDGVIPIGHDRAFQFAVEVCRRALSETPRRPDAEKSVGRTGSGHR